MLRDFIESRLCDLVADQQRCEVEWRGAFWSKLPSTADALSDIALMDQYERFISLKILRDSHN